MDVPELPKTRPTRINRENSESSESNSLSEATTTPKVPSHRPAKSSTATPALPPQIPKTRPKRNHTDDSSSLNSSTDLQSTPELTPVVPSVPKTRPNTSIPTSTSTPPSSSSASTSESKTQLPPTVPLSRPKVDNTIHEKPVSDIEVPKIPLNRPSGSNVSQPPKVPSTRPRNATPQLENNTEKSKEEEYEIITASEVAETEEKTEIKTPSLKEESDLETSSEKNVIPSKESDDNVKTTPDIEQLSEVVKDISDKESEVNTEAPLTDRTNDASKTQDEITETTIKSDEFNEKSDEVSKQEDDNAKLEEIDLDANNEPETESKLVLEDKTKEETIDQSPDTLKIDDIPIVSDQRKFSNPSAKKALDDLDSLEQEIELASKEISSLPTDDSEIQKQSENANKESISNNDSNQAVESEIPSSSALPQVPKSRPHPSKVVLKRPTTEPTETSANIETTPSSMEASHKKPPPKVPKKSSRIAQFQEMLEQQQKADLGLLNTPKPKPKIPVKHYDVTVEGVSDGKEVEVTDEAPVQKVDRVRSKFAENLNGMIGMGLPGMAFGGNPLAAIKAAKTAAKEDEDGNKEVTEESHKSKVKDVRRGRARGPRGRKLPDSVKKAVEINDQTLGNSLTVVVKDLWSFNFNEEILVHDAKNDAKKIEKEEIEPQLEKDEEKEDAETFQDAVATTSENTEVEKLESNSDEDIVDKKSMTITEDIPRLSTTTTTTDADVVSITGDEKEDKEAIQEEVNDGNCEIPKTTSSSEPEEEPKIVSELTSSIGSILSPLGSSVSEELSSAVAEDDLSED